VNGASRRAGLLDQLVSGGGDPATPGVAGRKPRRSRRFQATHPAGEVRDIITRPNVCRDEESGASGGGRGQGRFVRSELALTIPSTNRTHHSRMAISRPLFCVKQDQPRRCEGGNRRNPNTGGSSWTWARRDLFAEDRKGARLGGGGRQKWSKAACRAVRPRRGRGLMKDWWNATSVPRGIGVRPGLARALPAARRARGGGGVSYYSYRGAWINSLLSRAGQVVSNNRVRQTLLPGHKVI